MIDQQTNEMSDLNKNVEKKDLVGEWLVPIKGEVYKIEFEHGGTTGRRVIWINGEVSSHYISLS